MERKRDSLLAATMKAVRIHGLDGVRIQHIGKLAGVAPGGIYTYFNGKEELLQACFEQVDRQIARIFDRITPDPQRMATDPVGEIRRLWTPYYRWLVSHPDETVFYHQFRDNPAFPAFNAQRDISYFASFLETVQAFEQRFHLQERVGAADILWLHVLTATVMYAKYVVEGVLPDTPETEESIFRLEMFGLQGILTAGGPPGGESG